MCGVWLRRIPIALLEIPRSSWWPKSWRVLESFQRYTEEYVLFMWYQYRILFTRGSSFNNSTVEYIFSWVQQGTRCLGHLSSCFKGPVSWSCLSVLDFMSSWVFYVPLTLRNWHFFREFLASLCITWPKRWSLLTCTQQPIPLMPNFSPKTLVLYWTSTFTHSPVGHTSLNLL